MYWNGRRAEAIAHTCALGLAIAARGPPWLLGSSCNASSVYSAPQAFPGWCRSVRRQVGGPSVFPRPKIERTLAGHCARAVPLCQKKGPAAARGRRVTRCQQWHWRTKPGLGQDPRCRPHRDLAVEYTPAAAPLLAKQAEADHALSLTAVSAASATRATASFRSSASSADCGAWGCCALPSLPVSRCKLPQQLPSLTACSGQQRRPHFLRCVGGSRAAG